MGPREIATLMLAAAASACGPSDDPADRAAARMPGGSGTAASRTAGDVGGTMASYRAARAVVERGLDALGGADAIDRARGLALDGEGVLDLGTLLQGQRPFEGGDPHAITERLAIIPSERRLVHELDAPINPDAASWWRVDHQADGTYRMNLHTGRAAWGRPGSRLSVERTIPHLLLAEVLAAPAGLRHLGSVRVGSEARDAVAWSPPDRSPVTLLFDPATGLIREVESLADLPVRGDAVVRWSFREWSDVPGLGPYPGGYSIHVDDERLQEIRWTTRTAGPEGGILDPPAGIELPDPVPFADGASDGGGGGAGGDSGTDPDAEPFDIREVAPGVHLLLNLRTGFHMLFVELEDRVVAVDAPSGWWELQELPPRDWARSASPALGERYVAGIRSRVGDKPIGEVILTHHHSDHVGGVRAFMQEGATVLGTEVTRPVVERVLSADLSLAGGREVAPPLDYRVVDSGATVGDGNREIRVLDVGPNPHAEGMLVVWLPGERILYVSDLFEPWGEGASPSPQRLPVMRWFVDWLDASGLEPDRIYAIHRAALVSEANLEAMRR